MPVSSQDHYGFHSLQYIYIIRVTTKLPNSEQSYEGKVKTIKVYKQTKSVNNWKTVKTVMILTWYRHFQRNGMQNDRG
jgi:hypothetical protein